MSNSDFGKRAPGCGPESGSSHFRASAREKRPLNPSRGQSTWGATWDLGSWPLTCAALGLLAGLSGCTPTIGDKCVLSTDCSIRGDRLCDTSQPGGYCTQFNCRANLCPDQAACVLFDSAVPGCAYDDRAGGYGSRVARSFCVAQCKSNADCRDGYICTDPRQAPWRAMILDDDQTQKTCLVVPPGDGAADGGFTPSGSLAICSPNAPDAAAIEAGAASIEADAGGLGPLFGSTPDAGALDAGDAGDASDGG